MQRVAALFLPMWPLDRLRQAERRALPEPGGSADMAPISAAMAEEHARGCSVPREAGWRPGASWARRDAIAALPTHQRPSIRQLGRCDVAAEHAFKHLKPPAPAGRASSLECEEDLLVTSLRVGNRVLIAAASPGAQALGIRTGMPLTQARAQVPDLDVRPAEPEADAADLRRLAVMLARRWTPTVAIAGEDSLFLDLTGVAHLHGGETRMARRLIRMLARRGVTAQVAIADTPGAAWALVRHKAHPYLRCAPGSHVEALAVLPIDVLRLPTETVELLHRLGVERVAQLLALPRAPLARRFGAQVLARRDQALGDLPEPLDPVVPNEHIAVTQRFAEPIATPDAIAHWLGMLVARLVQRLAEVGKGARLVELVAERIDGVPQRVRIGLSKASRDPAHLLRLLAAKIDFVEPGYGIDMITLHLRRAEPLAAQSFDKSLDVEAASDLTPLIDMLATRIGMGRLWRVQPVQSDVPERSLARAPVLDPPARRKPLPAPQDVRLLDRRVRLPTWHPGWPRPTRLLRRPERVDHVIAEMPDRPPRRFTWRGRVHCVVRADGPERIHGEWWKRSTETHSVRDYFQIEDERGHRYWLFRRGDGERAVTGDLSWYLHGVFG